MDTLWKYNHKDAALRLNFKYIEVLTKLLCHARSYNAHHWPGYTRYDEIAICKINTDKYQNCALRLNERVSSCSWLRLMKPQKISPKAYIHHKSGLLYGHPVSWAVSPAHRGKGQFHYTDVIMTTMASQITSPTIVCSTVYSCADQRKHQSSASLAFVRGIHREPVNSPRKWPVTRKMFPFDDVIMSWASHQMHVGIANPRWQGKRSRHSGACTTRNFTYLTRGPLPSTSNSKNQRIGRDCSWTDLPCYE